MTQLDPTQWPDDGLPTDSLRPVFDELGQPRPGDAELLSRLVEGALATSASPAASPAAKSAGGLKLILGGAGVGAVLLALGLAAQPAESTARAESPTPVRAAEPTRPPAPPAPLPPAPEAYSPAPPPVQTSAPPPELAPVATPTPASEPSAKQGPSAAQLLEQANAARRRGESERALNTYANLIQRFPRSREAQTALVARGRLQLDLLAAPAAAAADFARYLERHPSGALAREAALGRAKAWRAAGDRNAECEALRYVVEHYPGTVHAATAATRLEALD